MIEALDIHVTGVVQGVGFRPFVYRTAKRNLISGWVLNAVDGVDIHAEGEANLLDAFVIELSENAPSAAQVKEIDLKEVPLQHCEGFEIRFSDASAHEQTTLVSPDLATCDDCVRELFDPADRRFRYPFINCTNCGPRFTIIDDLPYDRPATSMKSFEMCPACAAEYADPANRRFHAQPNACFECGPHVSLAFQPAKPAGVAGEGKAEGNSSPTCAQPAASEGASASLPGGSSAGMHVEWGRTRKESDAIFAKVVSMLLDGKIVAVKGLGGFHLVCDAASAQAVEQLRVRKRREGKAFAVMVQDVDAARAMCQVSDAEARLLESPQRPIVLLKKRAGIALTPKLADALPELGVMLPCTPVQHLLMHDFAEAVALTSGRSGSSLPPMLVMTSGNVHDEPIVTDDEQAYQKLAGIADAFLGNDRPILSRYDDSVMRVIKAGSAGDAVQMIRRARGYCPAPLKAPRACQPPLAGAASGELAAASPALLATGPEQKNTFAFVRAGAQGGEAFVSQHIGDLEDVAVSDAWAEARSRFAQLFRLRPEALACDMHPEYLSSKWAHEQAGATGMPLVEVQHHHAHIASVLGEHQLDEAVCGIAFDGTGYGADGRIWGGEVLLANQQAFERFANFAYVPMPGGSAAIKNPLRMAYGVLWEFDLLDHPGAADALNALGREAASVCERMIERGLNTPFTSSVGRLFDAASALLGVCTQPTYEGEPAILLEAAITQPEGGKGESKRGKGESGEGKGKGKGKGKGGEAPSEAPAPIVGPNAAPLAGDPVACSVPASGSGTGSAGSADGDAAERYRIEVVKNTATEFSTAQDTSVVLFDAEPAFRALLDDKAAGVPTSEIARRFHQAFIGAIVDAAQLVRAVYGIDKVALSGGVFMNRFLIEGTLERLEQAGFTVAINRDLPPNDGCVSYGQAVVACAARNNQA